MKNNIFKIIYNSLKIKNGKIYSLKIINKEIDFDKMFMIKNEINILEKISNCHSNIINLYDYFETPVKVYLVMDFYTGGDLLNRVNSRSHYYEVDAANIIYSVCSVVSYLHDNNIVHRDIRAENILFKNKSENSPLFLTGFHFSMITDDKKNLLKNSNTITDFMAPEIITKIGHNKPVDMWSIGVLTYFLLCGFIPFSGQDINEKINNILSGNYRFEPVQNWFTISENARDFIKNLLIVNPNLRMTAKIAMQHPWLQQSKINTDEINNNNNFINEGENKKKNTSSLHSNIPLNVTALQSKLNEASEENQGNTTHSFDFDESPPSYSYVIRETNQQLQYPQYQNSNP
eukprot:jgi/Orpsp1_1/1179799/evm.model.c7180000070780.1